MKQIVLSIATFFVFLHLYTRFAGGIPFTVSSTVTQKTDTFMVEGDGKVSVTPDIALVQTGVTATGSTVKQTQTSINTVINAVSAAIKQLGVEDKDIETTNYSISPTYDYTSGSQRITGYQASTNLTIKVRNIDRVNDVIDEATKNGANQVNGVSFDVDDRTKAENEAREEAVQEAKKKAEMAASIAGFRLKKIINYSEGVSTPPVPYARMELMGLGGDAKAADTQLEPGSTEITVHVTLSYEIQ